MIEKLVDTCIFLIDYNTIYVLVHRVQSVSLGGGTATLTVIPSHRHNCNTDQLSEGQTVIDCYRLLQTGKLSDWKTIRSEEGITVSVPD